MTRKTAWWILAAAFCLCWKPAAAFPPDPFSVSGSLDKTEDGGHLGITFSIPAEHYIYAESIAVTSPAVVLHPVSTPDAKRKYDPFQDKEVALYDTDTTFRYRIGAEPPVSFTVAVSYQGCSADLCYLPATKTVRIGDAGEAEADAAASATGSEPADAGVPGAATNGWAASADRYEIGGQASGYLDASAFQAFLEAAKTGDPAASDSWQGVVDRHGWVLAALLILLGGMALNLTPCVLPMIPVNLAIIGAGAQASSRGRGTLLGAVYGAGMAIVYGVLGLLVVLAGARFGALNASPWFNAGIAVLFLVMALAMFDVVPIDLSRFQSKADVSGAKQGSLPAAFVLGGVIALLAGACVAPVVISVLLFATDLYAAGARYALVLPFLLGVGMALPWPFAGAGLSFLPKPGKWMQWVKIAFGVVILAFAVYYGRLAFSLFQNRRAAAREQVVAAQRAGLEAGWTSDLSAGLRAGLERNRPVLIDFWASWCKSCLHMEKTTFKDPAVRDALESFVKVKYQAEDLSDPAVEAVLNRFNVIGLPTYVVLLPQTE